VIQRVATAPPLLVLQLKRFASGAGKISDRVALPEQLHHPDLAGQTRYKLVAVVRHKGISMRGGHYVATGTRSNAG
jgi:ubiquitin C-terminal hydrolase